MGVVVKIKQDDDGREIRAHIAAGEQEFRLAAEKLIEVRRRLNHGEWEPWLKENGIAARTAQRLIQEYGKPELTTKRREAQATRNHALQSNPPLVAGLPKHSAPAPVTVGRSPAQLPNSGESATTTEQSLSFDEQLDLREARWRWSKFVEQYQKLSPAAKSEFAKDHQPMEIEDEE